MINIPLYTRTELPPRTVGAAEPPYSLADKSGDIEFGQTLAKFGGTIFEKLVQTRAVNEEHEFYGVVNTAMADYETYVAQNPGAPYDKLQGERDKMMGRIRVAGQRPDLTGIARRNITNWYARNENLIHAKTQASMERIRSRQELERYQVQRENYILNSDNDKLANLNAEMVKAGLLDSEVTKYQQEQDFAVMDVRQQKFLLEQAKVNVEGQAFALATQKGYSAAEKWLREPATMTQLLEAGLKREDARSLLNDIEERVKWQQSSEEQALEQQREKDRGKIYDAIETGQVKLEDGTISTDLRAFIETTSLDQDGQADMWQKAKKEIDRKLKGEDIITNSQARSQFYKDTMGILTGAQTRDEILARVKNARFGDYSDPKNPKEPVLNDPDYRSLIIAINAQYEQGYGQMMSKVNSHAEGILLNPDSLGYIKNAPIRYKTFGDFQEAWLQWVAAKGDTLKISEIYPEGRRLAASFQISDEEAERQEVEMNKELRQREKGITKPSTFDTLSFPPDERIPQKKWDSLSGKKRQEITEGWYKGGERRNEILKELKIRQTRKKLTPKIARRYLDMAGDDVEEAKRLAAEDGYSE